MSKCLPVKQQAFWDWALPHRIATLYQMEYGSVIVKGDLLADPWRWGVRHRQLLALPSFQYTFLEHKKVNGCDFISSFNREQTTVWHKDRMSLFHMMIHKWHSTDSTAPVKWAMWGLQSARWYHCVSSAPSTDHTHDRLTEAVCPTTEDNLHMTQNNNQLRRVHVSTHTTPLMHTHVNGYILSPSC